jgi:hypothetical protein
LAAGRVAPFILGLDVNTNVPDPSPSGTSFGVSGTATETLIGPIIAGAYQQVDLALTGGLGASVNETIGTTDGSATGSFNYVHTFPAQAAPGRQIPGVSWVAGTPSLTAALGTFTAGDVGSFVAGPANSGLDPNTTITAVSGTGDSATISIAPTASATGAQIGLGQNLTFADPTFSTGNVFTSSGAARSNIGVSSVTSTTLTTAFGAIVVPFGGAPGTSTTLSDARCLLTGWESGGAAGPAQIDSSGLPGTAPLLPFGSPGMSFLVAASGGFITQPNTAQAITPPAAAFVEAPDAPPVTTDATATIDRNVSNTTTLTLPATDTDATPVTGCSQVGSPSDARLSVSISNSPTLCQATLTDSGDPSTPATVTFQFNATDGVSAGNTSTVTVTIVPVQAVVIDDQVNAIAGNPRSATDHKTIVAKVTNGGTGTWHVCDTDISWTILVGGADLPADSVTAIKPGCVDLGSGASKRFRFSWNYGTALTPFVGQEVSLTASVPVRAGDINTANNSNEELQVVK